MRNKATSSNTGRNNIMKSNSQVIDELGASAQISTGVANIPNQIHYDHSKRKININTFLFGNDQK